MKEYMIVYDMIRRLITYRSGENADKVLKELKKEHKKDKIKTRNYKIKSI